YWRKPYTQWRINTWDVFYYEQYPDESKWPSTSRFRQGIGYSSKCATPCSRTQGRRAFGHRVSKSEKNEKENLPTTSVEKSEILLKTLKEKGRLWKNRWIVSGYIMPDQVSSVYFVNPTENIDHRKFLLGYQKGWRILLLIGPRASGKTIHVFRLMQQLLDENYLSF
ncbi:22349_t:CDS:2, partial [Rhizophagus irregularis]